MALVADDIAIYKSWDVCSPLSHKLDMPEMRGLTDLFQGHQMINTRAMRNMGTQCKWGPW